MKHNPENTQALLLQALDDAPPTQEQYGRLYTLARRIFDVRPWERLQESQILAVESDPAGGKEARFVSVMGALKTHFSVAVYPTLECLASFMEMDESPSLETVALLFERPFLQLVFDSKTRLLPGERETVAASGIRFKNGRWPSAQSFVPGYFPWKTGATETETLCEALEQLLAKLEAGWDIPEYRGRNGIFCTRSLRNGVWEETLRRHEPHVFNIPLDLPQALMQQILDLPQRDACIEADCCPMMMVRVGKPSQRQLCPRQLLLVDRASCFALGFETLSPDEGKAWSFSNAIPAFLKRLVTLGFRPRAMAFARPVMAAWAGPLCDMLGIAVDDAPCESLREVWHDVVSMLQRRM